MSDRFAALNIGDELAWDAARLVSPNPWVGHLPFAFWLIKALRPDLFVELGTHSGNSYFAFCQAMAIFCPSARAFAVDTWAGDEHAGNYGEEVFEDVNIFNRNHYSQSSTLMRTTFDSARKYFAGNSIDLLHIDGMHSYEAVRHDFETWQPTLTERAVVLFHDTNVRERDFGVWQFWKEISEKFPSFEFHHSNGLGVVGIGARQGPELQALFALSAEESASLRLRVSARGEAFQQRLETHGLREQLHIKDAHEANLAAQIRSAAAAAEATRAVLDVQRDVVAAKDAMIASIGNVSAARAAALETRDAIIIDRDKLAVQLLADLRAQRDATEAAYREVAHAHATIAAVREEVQATAHRYTSSASWQLTRPLRVAARLMKRQPAPSIPPQAETPAIASLEVTARSAEPPADSPAKNHAVIALRAVLMSRLQAFLTGFTMLRLPSAQNIDISIIVVLYNQAELTFGCVSSILETCREGVSIELILVDNCSTDLTPSLLDRIEGAKILRNASNLHFLKAVNQGAQAATGRALLLLNSDALLLPGAVQSALQTLDSSPDIGAVGGRIILLDGTLQEAGSIVWNDGTCSGYGRGDDPNGPDYMYQRDVDYCSGAFLLTSSDIWRELGGFDEQFAPAYYEETDYCLRLWESGRRVVFDPDVAITHVEFGSSDHSGSALALQAVNSKIFEAKHRGWLAGQFAPSPFNAIAARTARFSGKRVLVIEDRVPKLELGTGYPRSNRLLHELVAAGAQVALFPIHRHSETWHGVRQALDKRIEVLIAAEASQLRAYLEARRDHFDIILVCRPPNMKMFEQAIGAERDIIGSATVLYDAEALFVTRALQRREAAGNPASDLERHRMMAEEVALTRLANGVISVSASERATLEAYGAREVRLLGHSLAEQPVPTSFEDRLHIVFLGAIQSDDAPNADAVRWFANSILPVVQQSLGSDLRLMVVGSVEAPTIKNMGDDRLMFAGMVEDLSDALASARVMVVPSRLGAGIPHKVHQAAMLGIPMVVTPLIANQLGWVNEVEVLVAEDALSFAQACVRLYSDQKLWDDIQRRALERARRECAPEAFSATVKSLLAEVPITRRQPQLAAQSARADLPAALPDAKPNVSRPLETDYAAALPFGYPSDLRAAPRVAVICHIFYPELGSEILKYLANLPAPADLFLSCDTEAKAAVLRATFAVWAGGEVTVRIFENRGRDVAPKLIGFADAYEHYDLILHLHSKASTHAEFLSPWRRFLLENLVGSPAIVSSIMDAFDRLPDLGMVAPQHFEGVRRWLDWSGNFDTAQGLATRLGITLSPSRALDFPSGSMLWMRPAAIRPLLDLHLSFDDFPREEGQADQTLAHAIERLYFHVCERSGHSWIKVAQPALYWDTQTIVNIPDPAALSRFVVEHGVLLSGPVQLPCRSEPAPLKTQPPPGLIKRIAKMDTQAVL